MTDARLRELERSVAAGGDRTELERLVMERVRCNGPCAACGGRGETAIAAEHDGATGFMSHCTVCGGTGFVVRGMIELVSYCWHVENEFAWIAQGVMQNWTPKVVVSRPLGLGLNDFISWFRGLQSWGPRVQRRAAVAAAYSALKQWETCRCGSGIESHGLGREEHSFVSMDPTPRDVIELAELQFTHGLTTDAENALRRLALPYDMPDVRNGWWRGAGALALEIEPHTEVALNVVLSATASHAPGEQCLVHAAICDALTAWAMEIVLKGEAT